jgi:hypothetical protein
MLGYRPLSNGVRASIGKVKLNLEMSFRVPSQEILSVDVEPKGEIPPRGGAN